MDKSMNKNCFSPTHYKGKPAVFDSVARVFYTGFRTMKAARDRAEALNAGK